MLLLLLTVAVRALSLLRQVHIPLSQLENDKVFEDW